MRQFIYPTIDLFIYQLREEFGAEETHVNTNEELFWQNLPQDFRLHSRKDLDSTFHDYIEIFEDRYRKFEQQDIPTSHSKYKVAGYYYPVLLNDTYGLLFDCSGGEEEEDLHCFEALKYLAEKKYGNLGSTWVVSGYLSNEECLETIPGSETEVIAKKIYATVMNGEISSEEINQQWQYRRGGKILGADIFEVWQTLPYTNIEIPNAHIRHIFICIYPCKDKMAIVAEHFYPELMRLFCFRSKINWAYIRTRKIKKEMKDSFAIVRATFSNTTETDLDKMRKILEQNATVPFEYRKRLTVLEMFKQMMAVNLHNYDLCISEIESKAKKLKRLGKTDLNFLKIFSERVRNQYYTQVDNDLASLRPSFDALSDEINTIRGLVEIEKTLLDRQIEIQNRNIENLIASAGVGVGVASTAASAFSALVKDFAQFYPIKVNPKEVPWAEPLSNLMVIFLFSTVFGVLCGWGTKRILELLRGHNTTYRVKRMSEK